MKKVTAKLLSFATALLVSLSLHAAQFEEGKHYKELDRPHSESPLVTEFFSFYCPHCFNFEATAQDIKKNLPPEVKFEKSHVSFMGREMGLNMSKAYATMVSLKVESTMIPIMFDRVQVKRQPPSNIGELRQIFTDNGIEGEKFDAAFNGFPVDSMARRYDQSFRASGLTGVPALVVNGKYQVLSEGFENYNELINYLLSI